MKAPGFGRTLRLLLEVNWDTNLPRGLRNAVRHRALRRSDPSSIGGYEFRRFSQNGEDGILREMFRRIGAGGRFFVEFGVEDGRECNTAWLARRALWAGVMLEGSAEKAAGLARRYASYPQVRTVHAYITRENIVDLFRANGVPAEFDLLSIDIDGNDYWVWQTLGQEYRPRVVVIEYNATRPPPERWVMAYDPGHVNRDAYYGASLTSLETLGTRLGYALVGTDEHGVNAFFVRDDLLAASGFRRLTADEAYHPNAYGQVPRDGPFEAL